MTISNKGKERPFGNLLRACVVESECECCGVVSRRVGVVMGEHINGNPTKPVAYDVSFDLKRPSSATYCMPYPAKMVKFTD